MNADYGKRSYEYAIGCFKATSRQPLTEDQWNRLRNADRHNAYRLLSEYGFHPINESCSVVDSIELDMEDTVAFIRENAPDNELTNLLFFAEDSLNLKMLIKAEKLGIDSSSLKLTEGGLPLDVLSVCARTGDYSLLGNDLESLIGDISSVELPGEISCIIDNAMFMHSVKTAKAKLSFAFASLLTEYGKGRNRLTALRLKKLGKNPDDYKYAFLNISSNSETVDENSSEDAIISSVKRSFDDIINRLDFDEGMGFIARYYFLKKNDAAALRLLFAQKTIDGGNDHE